MIKIAINGFGRIGRASFRIALKSDKVEVVAINDLVDNKTLAHLLKYDSVYGKFDGQVDFNDDNLYINNKQIPVSSVKDPSDLPWKKLGIDIVLESTGKFNTKELANKHIKAGAKRVILSAPPKDEFIPIFVLGVNEAKLDFKNDIIISNGSCTTNCIAPVLKILNKELEILNSFFTTIHAYTSSQKIIDLPHKDLRRARAADLNIIPTTTGASKSVIAVLPELATKLHGLAVRVPVPIVSLVDIVCLVNQSTTIDNINNVLKNASEQKMKGIIDVSYEPLVSSDFIANPYSVIIDGLATNVNDNLIKLILWYDNEYGYASRYVEMAEYVGRHIS